MTSIRVILGLVAMLNLKIEQIDVKTAFLHGDLEEDVSWNRQKDFSSRDDMLIVGKHVSKIKKLKGQLSKEFEMKDLGRARNILGMKIKRDTDKCKLWLSEEKCIMKILARFNMESSKPEIWIPRNPPLDTCSLGGAISWQSKLQRCVVLSTTEAAYIAVTESCKELLWLNELFKEIVVHQDRFTILCDSQSAIHLSKNPSLHSKSKHIDVRYYWVRDVLKKTLVFIDKVHANDNGMDMFTKVLPKGKFDKCCLIAGLGTISSSLSS
ncbi:hypothetical protein LIER_09040 [Lithospermum erythrorhizon]|uniref:Reverse transcriptase Ty1/copia-type domain-containing protein n=1 Tax=Lithospermum erythrorhizon TaxID=34254 RepID=A0AAV3PE48_LITER